MTIRKELGDKPGIANALSNLGIVASAQNDYEEARTLLQEALALCREIRHFSLIRVLSDLGQMEREVGDYARASTLFQESLLLSRNRGDALATAQSLEDFAGLAGRQGQFERAVRLLGAAEATCAVLGRTSPAGVASEYERTVAASQTALGKEAFAAVWEAGRAMTLEQAVTFALESP